MKLQATKELRVFVDRLLYSADVSFTEVGKVPEDKRENLSWKGCYYTIQAGEVFHLILLRRAMARGGRAIRAWAWK